MTHYTIDYSGLSNREKDSKALQDVKDYLGDRFPILEEILLDKEGHTLKGCEISISFAGIQGPPVFALLRKYRLEEFRAWMADDSLEGSIQTDEEGFPLPK